MTKSKRYIFLSLILLLGSDISFARVKLFDFESTRMKQTSGAGIGSLLINETTILNPASITFLGTSTLYYQKDRTNLEEKNSARGLVKEGQSEFIGFSDVTTKLKGGFSYLRQNEFYGKRNKFSLSSAGAVTKQTSMGIIYSYVNEDSEIIDNTYHQFTFGLTHIFSEALTIGLVLRDPQKKVSEYSYYGIGLHYSLNEFIHFIADTGSGDTANSEKQSFTRYAVQLNSFKYLYFRAGRFHDKFNDIKGLSYGISWVGPKFSLDYAYKNSERISEFSDELLQGEQLVETSLALTALF